MVAPCLTRTRPRSTGEPIFRIWNSVVGTLRPILWNWQSHSRFRSRFWFHFISAGGILIFPSNQNRESWISNGISHKLQFILFFTSVTSRSGNYGNSSGTTCFMASRPDVLNKLWYILFLHSFVMSHLKFQPGLNNNVYMVHNLSSTNAQLFSINAQKTIAATGSLPQLFSKIVPS